MKLKISQVIELQSALSRLDGIQKTVNVVTNGVTVERVITEPFKFGGKIRWNLSKNLAILTRILGEFDKARNDLLLEVSEGAGIIKAEDCERIAKFNQQLAEMRDSEDDVVGILTIGEADLNLDVNPIPLAVLMALEPIIS